MSDVEVVWRGKVVGRLCGMTVDQPQYYGRWESAGEPEFIVPSAALDS